MTRGMKAMSLRLPETLGAELAAVARADGVTISDAVRDAGGKHIATRRTDRDFQQRLKKRMEEELAVVERLAE